VRILRWTALAAAACGLGLAALYFLVAERVEVVVLHTRDAEGPHTTRLWVVDDAGRAWLRTGRANASWLPRLRANPEVELEREGRRQPFRAVVVEDAASVARVNQLTLEKYGWSEELLRGDGAELDQQLAIRLDPR